MDQPAPASPGSALQRAPEISQDQPIITGTLLSANTSCTVIQLTLLGAIFPVLIRHVITAGAYRPGSCEYFD